MASPAPPAALAAPAPLATRSEPLVSRPMRQRLLPRLRMRLSLVVVAVLASLACTAAAHQDAPSARITSSPPLDTPRPLFGAERPVTTMSVPRRNHAAAAVPAPLPRRDLQVAAAGSDTDRAPPRDGSSVPSSAASTLPTAITVSVDRPTSTSEAPPPPLPSPFDTALATDFRGSGNDNRCPTFMSNLLSDPTFKSCYPLSMLIQTSTGFFDAQKTLLGVVRVLDATCKADVSSCAAFLSNAAENLTSAVNCKAEVDQEQALVLQAWRGLKAYKTLYSATCLQDATTNMYCFANAVTNLTTPSDAYLYFMPYGLALPGGSTPTCNWCTRETMAIYHTTSADRQQFVASKYEDASRQINTLCGPGFVNGTLPRAIAAAGIMLAPSYAATLAAACAAAVAISSWI